MTTPKQGGDPIKTILHNEELKKEVLTMKQQLFLSYMEKKQRADYLRSVYKDLQDRGIETKASSKEESDEIYQTHHNALQGAYNAAQTADKRAMRAYKAYRDHAPELSPMERVWQEALSKIGEDVGGTSTADRTPEQIAEYSRLVDEFFEAADAKVESIKHIPLCRKSPVGFVIGIPEDGVLLFMDEWRAKLFVEQLLDRLPEDFLEHYYKRSQSYRQAALQREKHSAEMFIADLQLDSDTFDDNFSKVEEES